MNVNVWDVTAFIKRLTSERVVIDDRTLSDPDVPLDEPGHVGNGSAA